jgi:hypothetical protein
MPPKKNPLKLNKLQLRTLALAQVLARDPETGLKDEASWSWQSCSCRRLHRVVKGRQWFFQSSGLDGSRTKGLILIRRPNQY